MAMDSDRSVAVELLDRNVARAAEGRVPAQRDGSSLRQPPSARASAFGSETLKEFASGAPPPGFPARQAAASPRHADYPPATTTPRAACFEPPRSPRAPLHGSVTTYNQQAVKSLLSGVSPRAHLPQPTGISPPEWKIEGELMNQKWGSVLRTLQPSAAGSAAYPDGGPCGSNSPRAPRTALCDLGQGSMPNSPRAPLSSVQNYLRPPMGFPCESPRGLLPLSARPQLE